jgi:hypothetical protein
MYDPNIIMTRTAQLDEYPGYIIYDCGEVFSIRQNKFMIKHVYGGYYKINVVDSKNIRRKILIHRLVACAFINNDDPNNKKIVDHINRNRLDNDYINLRWVTRSENAHNANLSKNHNIAVCQYALNNEFIKRYQSIICASKETNTKYHMINMCCRGIRKNALAGNGIRYLWKYEHEKKSIECPIGRTINNLSRYIILDNGNVYSIIYKKYLRSYLDSDGYKRISLISDLGKKYNYLMHRLVMEAYCGSSTLPVNHKNCDRADNRLENLEYVTTSDNNKHAHKYGKRKKSINHETHRKKIKLTDEDESTKLTNKDVTTKFERSDNEGDLLTELIIINEEDVSNELASEGDFSTELIHEDVSTELIDEKDVSNELASEGDFSTELINEDDVSAEFTSDGVLRQS